MNSITHWFQNQFLGKKLSTPVGLILFALVTFFVSFIVVKGGMLYGLLVVAAAIGLVVALLGFNHNVLILAFLMLVSIFVFPIERILLADTPLFVLIDLFVVLGFASMFIQQIAQHNKSWDFIKSPITVIYFIYIGFILVQFFNPNMGSVAGYWAMNRRVIAFLILFITTMYFFRDEKYLQQFITIWMVIAIICALYGLKQEYFGISDFEQRYFNRHPESFRKIFNGGRLRKFSFFNDPTAFGLFCSYSALFFLVLYFGDFAKKKRWAYLFTAAVCVLAMAYSGTRTATATMVAGILIFIFMTITQRRTLILLIAFVAGLILVLYGPYQNKTTRRLRSTFEYSQDASFNVREENRKSVQPYMYDNPLGGGYAASGTPGRKFNPDHFLAGFPPDSGFMRAVLETGWIGLIILIMVFLVVLLFGVSQVYNSDHPRKRTYYLAFTVSMYGMAVSFFSQEPFICITLAIMFNVMIAFMAKLRKIEFKDEYEQQESISS